MIQFYLKIKNVIRRSDESFPKLFFNWLRWKLRGGCLYYKIIYFHWDGKENFENEIQYLKKTRKLTTFPYSYQEKYKEEPAWVREDEHGVYTLTNDEACPRKLYFPYNKEKCAYQYKTLRIEQDPESPHRYYTDGYYPEPDDILIDIGSAEGKEVLSVVDICKEFYLFECEPAFNSALHATFKDYPDKVKIKNCYIGSEDDDRRNIRKLDTLFGNFKNQKLFIKMDVEGMERDVLAGARQLLANNHVRILVTTYHLQNDDVELPEILKKQGFSCRQTKNYMLFIDDKNMKPPYFRRGLVRGRNF